MFNMTIQEILDLTWVPVLTFGISLGVGINMLITKSPQILRGKKDKTVYKDAEGYAVTAGYLMLLLALGSLIMTALLFVDVTYALIESVTVIVIFAFLWKKMHAKYGPI